MADEHRHGRTTWAEVTRKDRTRKTRAALTNAWNARKRGEDSIIIWSKDLSPLLPFPIDYLMKLGREHIDDLQVEGAVVSYLGGGFIMKRPPLRSVE